MAQIDKHQSDVCTLLHASLSLSYVSISTPCDFLYTCNLKNVRFGGAAPCHAPLRDYKRL
jgi:hypothetical protein